MAQTTVHVRSVHDAAFAVGWAGKHSLTIDRPEQEAGYGYGFSGGDLLLMAIGACFVNDLQQEAERRGVALLGARVVCECDWGGEPVRAQNIKLSVRIEAAADEDAILELAEAVATSDVPGGVVNLLTGFRKELAPILASHMDVNALDVCGADGDTPELERLAAENVKRIVHGRPDVQSPWEIAGFLELKTVWHPVGT